MNRVLESENTRLTAANRRLRRDLDRTRSELVDLREAALEVYDLAREHVLCDCNDGYFASLARRIGTTEVED